MRKILLPEKEICQLYIDGKSAVELAEQYKCSTTPILSILKRCGIQRRDGATIRRKHALNESFFEKIDTQEKAYILGFLCADGCLTPKNHRNCGSLSLYLHSKDIEIIEFIIPFLYKGPKSISVTNRELAGFRLYSQKIFDDLVKLGCGHLKTFSLKLPTQEQVPLEFFGHFLRGMFDGDGCISSKGRKATFSITSSRDFCLQLHDFFLANSIKSCIFDHNRHGKNCFSISVASREGLKFIYEIMYGEATCFLNRKKNKFQNLMEDIDFMTPIIRMGGDSPHAKRILQIDPISSQVIREWSCLREASNSLGKGKNISPILCRALKHGGRSCGYLWKYA